MTQQYDTTIQPGDIIQGYMTGFWRVEEVEDRSHSVGYGGRSLEPLHHCVKMMQPDGDKSKRLRGHWSALYSTKMTPAKVAEMKAAEQAAHDKRFKALESLIILVS